MHLNVIAMPSIIMILDPSLNDPSKSIMKMIG